ncbi:probable WRKY transcription factor protein 1 [Prorops nasuta]|uniref:probable WRKY transcription factor protein 1 n=1 Tax=Prorops nasuta TaxID=863751 RepID=UPI0034CE72CB
MAEPLPNRNESTKDLLRTILERVEENGVLLHQIQERLKALEQQQQLQPQQQQQPQQQLQQQQQQQVAVQAFVPATQAARPGYIRSYEEAENKLNKLMKQPYAFTTECDDSDKENSSIKQQQASKQLNDSFINLDKPCTSVSTKRRNWSGDTKFDESLSQSTPIKKYKPLNEATPQEKGSRKNWSRVSNFYTRDKSNSQNITIKKLKQSNETTQKEKLNKMSDKIESLINKRFDQLASQVGTITKEVLDMKEALKELKKMKMMWPLIEPSQKLSKSLTNVIQRFITREVFIQFTIVKKIKEKLIFKDTFFCTILYDIMKKTYGGSSSVSPIREKKFYPNLSIVLNNAKDWDGHRNERKTSSQKT